MIITIFPCSTGPSGGWSGLREARVGQGSGPACELGEGGRKYRQKDKEEQALQPGGRQEIRGRKEEEKEKACSRQRCTTGTQMIYLINVEQEQERGTGGE